MKHILYIGTYTKSKLDEQHRKEGILIYNLDTETGRLERVSAVESGQNPSFLALRPGGRFLYAANELNESEASAFSVDPGTGGLTFLNRQPTRGMHSCYVSLDPAGRWLLVANYSSGNLTVLPVREDGSLGPLTDLAQHEGTGPNQGRQERAHAHSIRFDPTGQFALAADLGIDRVMIYRLDEQAGRLVLHDGESGKSNPGAGPRHMEWHPGGKILYVANELDGTVSIYSWDAQAGCLLMLETYSTLPEGFKDENIVADIHLTPDGKYLYVSNRGHNSLAAFRVDGECGLLSRVGIYSCGGNWPRNFTIHPQGKYLLVANQFSGNVVVFAIQEDGSLKPTGEEIQVPAPVALLFG